MEDLSRKILILLEEFQLPFHGREVTVISDGEPRPFRIPAEVPRVARAPVDGVLPVPPAGSRRKPRKQSCPQPRRCCYKPIRPDQGPFVQCIELRIRRIDRER